MDRDEAGQKFKAKVLAEMKRFKFRGKVSAFSATDSGVKDISDLYAQNAYSAKDKIQALIDRAERIVEGPPINVPVKGMPVDVKIPFTFTLGEDGIKQITKDGSFEWVCKTPIIITRSIRDIESPLEKIELAFKVHGHWVTDIFDRTTIFNKSGILCLANYGCNISTDNAHIVTKFLSKMDMVNNFDVRRSSRCFGWVGHNEFLPYVSRETLLDIEHKNQTLLTSIRAVGEADEWVDYMNFCRENTIFRFVMAASFAAPLAKLLKIRTFMLYNWGGSKTGKSASLRAAMSVWGSPDALMRTFNSTLTTIERYADIMNNLPVGINERQLAKDQEELEKIVYMLAEGKGKGRSDKEDSVIRRDAT